jgi:hypothetical protein
MQTDPKNTTPPRFCKDCAHFIPVPKVEAGVLSSALQALNDQPRCRLLRMLDVVTGEPFYVPCSHLRDNNEQSPCGLDGKLFEPKAAEPAAN